MVSGLITYVSYKLIEHEHRELEELSEELTQVLWEQPGRDPALSQPLPKQAIMNFNKQLGFLHDAKDYNLSYAVYDASGEPFYVFSAGIEDLFPQHYSSKTKFFIKRHTYKDWRFFKATEVGVYTVLVCSLHHLDSIDHVLIGLAVIVPVSLALSALLGSVISRWVLVPITEISTTAAAIHKGDLGSRITMPKNDDEVARMIVDLNEAFDHLETSFARISQFSADAAHELRTPLTALRGNLEVCLRQPRTAREYEETISAAIDEIRHTTQVIEVLLTLARDPEASQHTFSPTSFSAVVGQVCEQLGALWEERHITVTSKIEDGVMVNGDRVFLHQMCYNLLHNAFKFSSEGQEIVVRLSRSGQHCRLSILDYGCGIPDEIKPRVFERFVQVDSSRRTGTGLGLSLVQWIVKLHHGEIALESTFGKGTVVEVELPAISLVSNA